MSQETRSVVPDARKTDVYLRRIARTSAWLLLITIIVLLISGWGITRTEIIYKASLGLIDRGEADSIHRAIQVPAAVFFTMHVLLNVRLNLPSRYLRKAWLVNSLLVAIGVCVVGGVVFMEYFA
jgi:cytochrome b subunit of formate dehydrogenase